MSFAYETSGELELRVFRSKSSDRAISYTALYLSPTLERQLPFGTGSRLRIEGELEGAYEAVAVQLAWQSDPARGHYVMVSPALCKQLDVGLGDRVTLRFNIADSTSVELPAELREALAASAKRRRLWDALTPGRKRGLCHFVSSAKQAATRSKRIALLFEELESGKVKRTGPVRQPKVAPKPANNARRR